MARWTGARRRSSSGQRHVAAPSHRPWLALPGLVMPGRIHSHVLHSQGIGTRLHVQTSLFALLSRFENTQTTRTQPVSHTTTHARLKMSPPREPGLERLCVRGHACFTATRSAFSTEIHPARSRAPASGFSPTTASSQSYDQGYKTHSTTGHPAPCAMRPSPASNPLGSPRRAASS